MANESFLDEPECTPGGSHLFMSIVRFGIVAYCMNTFMHPILPILIVIYVVSFFLGFGALGQVCDLEINGPRLSVEETQRLCSLAYFWTVMVIGNLLWIVYLVKRQNDELW